MVARLNRRRLITIAAVAGALAICPLRLRRDRQSRVRWQGIAMGAQAQIQLYHPDQAAAAGLLRQVVREMVRLESCFSLYQSDSWICRLNREGQIRKAPKEVLHLLGMAKQFAEQTDGLFDPTIQPLWLAHAQSGDRQAARHLVDHRKLQLSQTDAWFERPGMAVTLNGIAQGYITDRITTLLKAGGISSTLVCMGEMRALGSHADGEPWRIGVAHTNRTVSLENRALATSGAYGHRFDAQRHHLIHPHSGACPHYYESLSVLADDATTADALSTALSMVPLHEARQRIRQFEGAELMATLSG